MLFSSATFLFAFLPVVVLVYYLLPKRCAVARNIFLTAVSLLFYAWGEPRFVLVMLLVIVLSWFFARKIETTAGTLKKALLAVAVGADLTVLFIFKYIGFFTENLNHLPFVQLPVPQITLPIGISFFTFQAISYVADVYRGHVAQKSLWDVMLYIAFFPQLIAGPIVRYSDFADQIRNRQESLQKLAKGGYRFALGLGKKVILSNNLAYVADAAFSSVGNLSLSMAWLGAIGYSLQLYFDFSGYSDMAIGLGQMFGFRFLENFNYPFISRSITELWRRWHISLGSWFRDYVYIPLGGSRVKTKRRLYLNIFVVWLLTGVWHGAKWTYIAWGMMYFALLCAERILGWSGKRTWYSWLYTIYFFVAGNVVFRSENVTGAIKYLLAMFNIHTSGLTDAKAVYYFAEYIPFLIMGIVAAMPVAVWLRNRTGRFKEAIDRLYPIWCAAVFLVALSFVVKGGYNPFIYFDF